MRLTVKLSELNYGDAAVKAMPLLAQAAVNQCGAIRETVEAFSQMVANVGAGQGMGEALAAFCRTVVENGVS